MNIKEPAKSIKVVNEVAICVVGGSCTGVFAAVRAARMGATVAIIEKHNCFGGVATAGLVNVWHSLFDEVHEKKIIAGLTEEVIQRLNKRGAVYKSSDWVDAYRLNTEELKIELDELITEHRIIPYLNTFFSATVKEDDVLQAIIFENKSGRQAIRARVFIDATGDGDVARQLDCPAYLPESLQPPTTCSKILGLGSLTGWDWQQAVIDHGHEFGLKEDWGWGGPIPGFGDIQMRADTHVFDTNTAEGDKLTAAEIEGRRQIRAIMDIIRKYGPSHGKVDLVDLAASIGARETARIQATYQMTGDDVLYGRHFDDAIANGSYRVDIHHSDSPGITFRYLEGTEVIIPGRNKPKKIGRWRDKTASNPTYYQIPYRSLLQKKYRNLLLAGRMLDADKVAFSAVRVMVNMNQTGEAAGIAAFLALEGDISVQQVESSKLREQLKSGGSLIL